MYVCVLTPYCICTVLVLKQISGFCSVNTIGLWDVLLKCRLRSFLLVFTWLNGYLIVGLAHVVEYNQFILAENQYFTNHLIANHFSLYYHIFGWNLTPAKRYFNPRFYHI